MKIIHKILPVICILLVLSLAVSANKIEDERRVLFEIQDPLGDDYGPGNYTYPQYKQFEPYQGLFDLTNFAIIEDENFYTLEFTFAKITDPWRSKYRFSHPLIELYFDNQPGGSGQLFRPGAKVKFDQRALWDVMLHITGWWVRVFRPGDRQEAERSIWSDPQYPFDLEESIVTLKDNIISIELPREVLGDLQKAKFFLLVGAFDSFGPNYYREVKIKNDDWSFGGAVNDYSSRVIDLVVPANKTQAKVLQVTDQTEEFVTIPFIDISAGNTPLFSQRLIIWLAVFIVSLFLLIIIRRNSQKDSIDL